MRQNAAFLPRLIFAGSASVKFTQIFFQSANVDSVYGINRVKLRIDLKPWLMELIRDAR